MNNSRFRHKRFYYTQIFKFTLVVISLFVSEVVIAQSKSLVEAPIVNKKLRRGAVIIANQNYSREELKLKMTHNDADDMKKVLKTLGFEILLFEKDLSKQEFQIKVESIVEKLKSLDVVFFYYSGHGTEYNGENFFIPSDFPEIEEKSEIKKYCISLDTIYSILANTKIRTKILAIDACRNLLYTKRGFKTKENIEGGLILPKNAPAGTYTMFATKSKEIALENRSGRNSYFTQELLKNMLKPNQTITNIFKETKRGVLSETNNRQDPSAVDELSEEMVFAYDDEEYIKPIPQPFPNNPIQSLIEDGKLKENSSLRLKIKTNRGNERVEYKEDESMFVSYFVNEPSYLRLIYRLANGELVLLMNDIEITAKDVNKWVQISDEFICSEPFGFENLIAFASNQKLSPVDFYKKDGYLIINNKISELLETSRRGMKNKTDSNIKIAEVQLLILTKKK